MSQAASSFSPTDIAAIVAPLLALIIAFAIDSVEEGDSLIYRGLVATLSIMAVGPILYVILIGTWSEGGAGSGLARVFTSISLLIIEILIIGVLFVETSRGLDNVTANRRQRQLYYIVVGVIIIIWYGTLWAWINNYLTF